MPDLVKHYGFFYGATIINPLGLFDFNQINLSHELHYLIYGFVANAPAPAIGYAYSDFGFLGVFFYGVRELLDFELMMCREVYILILALCTASLGGLASVEFVDGMG